MVIILHAPSLGCGSLFMDCTRSVIFRARENPVLRPEPVVGVRVQVDRVADPLRVIAQAMARENTVAISALTGYGLPAFLDYVEAMIKVSRATRAQHPARKQAVALHLAQTHSKYSTWRCVPANPRVFCLSCSSTMISYRRVLGWLAAFG